MLDAKETLSSHLLSKSANYVRIQTLQVLLITFKGKMTNSHLDYAAKY